jgi:hypothetical protein
MANRTIQQDESPEKVWEELCFSRAALLTQTLAGALAESVKPLTAKSIELRREQWEHWEREQEAQAGVVAVNYVLDAVTFDLSEAKIDALREVNSGWRDREARESKEYEHYFPIAPNAIAKLAPEAQAPYMRPWLKALESETDKRLLDLLSRLTKALQEADTALQKREDAQAGTALHRLRSIEPFIAEVNVFRTKLYATLLTISQENRLPKSWADLFFRPAPQASPTAEARGMARALFIVLSSRGLSLTEEQQKKIAKSTELSLLGKWLSRAHTVATIEALFTE